MNGKILILFLLTAGMVAAALVFDGVSHRLNVSSSSVISRDPVKTPPSDGSANSSIAGPNAQSTLQSGDTASAPSHSPSVTDPGQNARSGDADQTQADSDVPTDASLPLVVPAGTTLTIRLGEHLGTGISEAGQDFSAILDRDVVVDGQTAIATGANVTGRVAFSRPAGALAGEAKLQLAVTSVSVNGSDLPVVTSVRNFYHKIKGKTRVGRFMRRLLKSGTIGCELTANYDLCADLVTKAGGKERQIVLDDHSVYSFTLRQPLQIE
jgi:hypothetical protein